MQLHTAQAIMAIMKADATVSASERLRILKPEATGETTDRLVRLTECASRLGISRRSVTNLLADGTLPRVTLPGRKRALGTRESALAELIAGRRGVA